MSNDMIITQWHVPIDNVSCYWYSIFTSFKSAVDRETMRQQRLQNHTLPDYRPKLNRDNNWGFNSAEQQRQTFTGMGMDINVHDQWAVESPGPIFDRTQEHLGKSDVGIIRYRKLLHEGIQAVQAEEIASHEIQSWTKDVYEKIAKGWREAALWSASQSAAE